MFKEKSSQKLKKNLKKCSKMEKKLMETIEVFLKVIVSYLIPIASFALSVFAVYKSNKVKDTEDKLKKLELLLKEYAVEELQRKQNMPKVAKIETRINKISKGNYRIRFWNAGNATAYNIRASIPEEYCVLLSDWKFPYEYLKEGESFEETVVICMGCNGKFKIFVQWEDENKKQFEVEELRSI